MLTAATWVGVVAVAQVAGDAALPGGSGRTVHSIVVEPGQTLWSVARAADPAADTQAVVQQVMKLNGLRGPSIAPGQHLRVPSG